MAAVAAMSSGTQGSPAGRGEGQVRGGRAAVEGSPRVLWMLCRRMEAT